MKYLYGDAEDFPEQYNFLETLGAFLECSGKAAALEHEISLSEEDLSRQVVAGSEQIEVVSQFCAGVIEDIRARATKLPRPEAVESYTGQLIEAVEGYLADAQAEYEKDSKRRRTEVEEEIDDMRDSMRELVDAFLTKSELGVESSSFSMRLSGHTVSLNASAEHAGGISTSFELDAGKSRQWGQPQKVQGVMPGLALQVGMRKKFLSKTLTPEVMQLDEHTITFVELNPDTCEVHISRRMDPPDDDLVIKMARAEDEVRAEIGAHGGERHAAETSDVPSLENFWKALDDQRHEAMSHRHCLNWVKLDGDDVIENGLMMAFVERLVARFAPISQEIARRSPNKTELSIKLEKGDGRREEIYVKKEELVRHIANLPEQVQERFAPLDIFPS